MRVVSLASGSSGNALLVEAGPAGRTKLLVDAGLSARLIGVRLRTLGVHPAHLQGILITHEHSDHVAGLPVLTTRFALPVIADPRTHKAISDISLPMTIALPIGSHCTIGDIKITSFPTSHDAVAPCGYLLSAGGCRVCLVTDSGEVTPAMLDVMQQADLLILEANHDRQRLIRGPYPHHLKQRILSSTGHLSNDQAANAVLRTWPADGIRWLWLAHLSRTNNTPTLALNSIRASLQAAGANLTQMHISTLPPSMGNIWDSTQLWHAPALWNMSL